MSRALFATPLLALSLGGALLAAGRTTVLQADDPTSEAVSLARTFLASLTAEQRPIASFDFDSGRRSQWSNLPDPIFAHNGLRIGDMTPQQKADTHALLKVALSPEGYAKVVDIMNADEALLRGRTGGGPAFGLDEYRLAIFGTPSATQPWMIQFGGHHLAINVTVVGAANVLTPSLTATQPARFTLGGETIRPLGDEYDRAFALIGALDAEQRREAVLSYQVADLVLGAGKDGRTIAPEGIRASRLTADQQTMLMALVGEWAEIVNPQAGAAKMAEIRGNLGDTYFAWSGPTEKGNAAYFRVHGPTVLIEYAPQGPRSVGDQGVDHVHTIYRDPTNDYAARLLPR